MVPGRMEVRPHRLHECGTLPGEMWHNSNSIIIGVALLVNRQAKLCTEDGRGWKRENWASFIISAIVKIHRHHAKT